MGRKIFASYKFADENVEELSDKYKVQQPDFPWRKITTVRSYINKLESLLGNGDHIYKGESDGEDLSSLKEEKIKKRLKKRIHDSSVTIVFISPGMKEPSKSDRNQWIPWEISYSLKDIIRGGLRSRTNAILAVVLPDRFGSYSYFEDRYGNVEKHKLFRILSENMDNRELWATTSEKSYIKTIKWSSFVSNYNYYIEKAVEIKKDINQYKISKEI